MHAIYVGLSWCVLGFREGLDVVSQKALVDIISAFLKAPTLHCPVLKHAVATKRPERHVQQILGCAPEASAYQSHNSSRSNDADGLRGGPSVVM